MLFDRYEDIYRVSLQGAGQEGSSSSSGMYLLINIAYQATKKKK
jgi:hypothetical protein